MNPTLAILGIIAIAVLAIGSAIGGSMFYFGLIPPKAQAAAKPTIVEHCLGKVTYLQFENAVMRKRGA